MIVDLGSTHADCNKKSKRSVHFHSKQETTAIIMSFKLSCNLVMLWVRGPFPVILLCPYPQIQLMLLARWEQRCQPLNCFDSNTNVCICLFICWASFSIKGLCPVLNKNWFCCRPMQHTHVAECVWNGGYICHQGTSFFEDVSLVEFM